MIEKQILERRHVRNVIALGNAVIRYDDGDDPDAYLQQLLAKISQAGLGEVANEILRVLARKSCNTVLPVPDSSVF